MHKEDGKMKNFSFVENRNKLFCALLALVVIGVVCFFAVGFNVDVDFAGGTEIVIEFPESIDSDTRAEVETTVAEVIGDKLSSVKASGDTGVMIRAKELTTDERNALIDTVVEKYGLDKDTALSSNENVSASVSDDLKKSAVTSATIAVVLMLLYITIRFKFSFAVASVVCLMHDIFVVILFTSILSIPVNSNIIAVILTILGYSINATIIVFDRVRENMKLNAAGHTYAQIIDMSIKQTLNRSLYTTLTTLFTIVMVYILGVPTIKDFALPLIIGIIAGLYSSVCLAGPIAYAIAKKK